MINKILKKMLLVFVLAAGSIGLANAGITIPNCSQASGEINAAIVHLDDAYNLIEELNLKARYKARMELRRAIVDITGAQVALADCGILPLSLDLADFDFSLVDPFQLLIDLEIVVSNGNITNETALKAARLLTEYALAETRGVDDGDALNNILIAVALLEWIDANL